MGRPSALREANIERRSQEQSIIAAAKHGPLQSLTEREREVRDQPVTIYPWNAQRRVKAWVRFGPEAIRVDAKLVRSTPIAAGVEFKAEGQMFQCWVWGNAVQLDDE